MALDTLSEIETSQGNKVVGLGDGHSVEIYAPVSPRGDRGYRLVGTAHVYLAAEYTTEKLPRGSCVRCAGKR